MLQAGAGRARFAWAALLGSLLSFVLFLALLAGPGPDITRDNGLLGSFYDVQAGALLDGRLDVEPEQAGLEGFRIEGKTYLYFGLVPALLRLPVQAVDSGIDGGLTKISMLIAFTVLMAGSAVLHWRTRAEIRPDEPIDRSDAVAAFLLQLAVGAGAVPLYLAGRAVVYHEAELWGAALSVAALAAVLAVVARPTARSIALAGLLAALAVNARFSVGLGPVLALALLAVGLAAQLLSRRRHGRVVNLVASFGPRRAHGGGARTLALLTAAVVVPLSLHGAVNSARFGSPFGIPIEKQVQSQLDPSRRAALAANGGTIFGLQFVPTTLVQVLRPDAVGWSRAFPFVGLPADPATAVGDVRFDTIEPSLSALTSMPALCLLTLASLLPLVRRRGPRPLLGVLAALSGGFALTLTIAFVTTRYLADFLPFLLLGALIGLYVGARGRRPRGLLLAAVAVLTVVGIVVNGGAGLLTQRLFYEASEAERAAFVDTQAEVDRFLGRQPSGVLVGPELPARAHGAPGDLFVLDRCAGLYVQGLLRDWLPVERTDRAGVHRLRLFYPRFPASRPQAVIELGSGPRRVSVTSQTGGSGTVFAVLVGRRAVAESSPIRLPGSGPVNVVVSLDFFADRWYTVVEVGGETAVTAPTPDGRHARAALGSGTGDLAGFSGRVERIEARATTCLSVASRAGLLGGRPAG